MNLNNIVAATSLTDISYSSSLNNEVIPAIEDLTLEEPVETKFEVEVPVVPFEPPKEEFTKEELEDVIIQLMQEERRYVQVLSGNRLTVVLRTLTEIEQANLNNEIQLISFMGTKVSRDVYYKDPANEKSLVTGEKTDVFMFADKSRRARFAELFFHVESINGENGGNNKQEWLQSFPSVVLDYIYIYVLSKFRRKVETALKGLQLL